MLALKADSKGHDAVAHKRLPSPAGPVAWLQQKVGNRESGRLLAPQASEFGGQPGVPPLVSQVLISPGQAIDNRTRAMMAWRFGQDLGRVRIHADAQAGESARLLQSEAYTVGRDIAFAPGKYQPETIAGRQLLAHELTHVVQQRGTTTASSLQPRLTMQASSGPAEDQARRVAGEVGTAVAPAGATAFGLVQIGGAATLQRADPRAVTLTTHLGVTPRTGIQFWPRNVKDTRVGPVSAQGGLLGGGMSQLKVIIGANLTLNALAAELRALWLTATPFTPPGALAPLPLDVVSQNELAQALLVYNQTYLPVPAMTNWRAGLRFPLPVDIDEGTGMATLHPLLIRSLATAFDPAWTPLLARRAATTTVAPAATLAADVTAFLAREPTASARGIELAARALSNTVADLAFIRASLSRLGATSFDVALSFMDNMVNREIQLLAAQREGAALLAILRTILAAPPPVRTAARKASLDRANLMLGLVAGALAAAPPVATHGRPEKTVTIDTVKLNGSTHTPSTDVAIANAIFAQCNVRISHRVNATATRAETLGWLGGDNDLQAQQLCAVATAEETALVLGATPRFGLGGRFRAFFPATISGIGGSRGFSWPLTCGPIPAKQNMVIVQNAGTERTLAHEIGHVLLNSVAHQPAATQNVMVPTADAPLAEGFTDADCATIYANA
jgi:Domain of unknown function (DUF4157)